MGFRSSVCLQATEGDELSVVCAIDLTGTESAPNGLSRLGPSFRGNISLVASVTGIARKRSFCPAGQRKKGTKWLRVLSSGSIRTRATASSLARMVTTCSSTTPRFRWTASRLWMRARLSSSTSLPARTASSRLPTSVSSKLYCISELRGTCCGRSPFYWAKPSGELT